MQNVSLEKGLKDGRFRLFDRFFLDPRGEIADIGAGSRARDPSISRDQSDQSVPPDESSL